MPGTYTDNGGQPPIQASLLTVLNGNGPPIAVPSIANFQEVPMGQQSGGPVHGAHVPGLWTGHRSDCVVIAVMQQDAVGGWESYYFTHLNGGLWTGTEQALFNAVINQPGNAFVAMSSNTHIGMMTLLSEMNRGNPAGNIPAANLLEYKTGNPTFALRLAGAGIGQVP
jgi:hypothetical protein